MRVNPAVALANVLVVGIAIYAYILFRENRAAAPETMSAILTAENAFEPVSLTLGSLEEASRQCIVAFNTQEFDGIRHIGKPEDVEAMLARFAENSCSCMIRHLEKRTNTFEFVLAMSMQFSFSKRDDYASFSAGDPKKREVIYPHATSIGLTSKQFDAAGIKAEQAIMAAGTRCMETNGA